MDDKLIEFICFYDIKGYGVELIIVEAIDTTEAVTKLNAFLKEKKGEVISYGISAYEGLEVI
ncbi:hypothetical protein [Bacillus toyonensis]|uniref:hypothetical protein n=1 Tax=Bacillus toyonensis TaxID=155322 RepID=UPI002E1FE920|nr:hypothetical protein [Bacillus toyonensis]